MVRRPLSVLNAQTRLLNEQKHSPPPLGCQQEGACLVSASTRAQSLDEGRPSGSTSLRKFAMTAHEQTSSLVKDTPFEEVGDENVKHGLQAACGELVVSVGA